MRFAVTDRQGVRPPAAPVRQGATWRRRPMSASWSKGRTAERRRNLGPGGPG